MNPNIACSDAIAMSDAATSPAPPPNAFPCTRATTGFGHSAIARQSAAAAAASRRFSSSLKPAARRIQSRSAPALNDFPSPASTTTRTLSSPPQLLERLAQLRDEVLVEGVVDLGPRHRDGGDGAVAAQDYEFARPLRESLRPTRRLLETSSATD